MTTGLPLHVRLSVDGVEEMRLRTLKTREEAKVGYPFGRGTLHNKYWKPLLRRARLLDTRFHDLRHTCATLLLKKGVHPKIVSEMLRHFSISIRLYTYSHMIPGLKERSC